MFDLLVLAHIQYCTVFGLKVTTNVSVHMRLLYVVFDLHMSASQL